jgi:iron complex outermembrane receptor protein
MRPLQWSGGENGEDDKMNRFSRPVDQPGNPLALARSSRRAMRLRAGLLAAAAIAGLAAVPAPALAQEANQRAADATAGEEIIVTARKREESVLKVPVLESVVTQETIERTNISNLDDITKFAPGLLIGQAAVSTGTTASIRGFGTFASNPGVDQSVALVIDGLSFTNGLAYQSATFDLAQVEVLKGPQSLFFGKSSPAGVIVLRTADPGNEFEVIARALYEIEARERRGEFIVSIPIENAGGLRLATAVWKSGGFFKNKAIAAPNTGALTPDKRLGGTSGVQVRGTLKAGSGPFDSRLKVNYVKDTLEYPGAFQMASCPEGTANTSGTVRTLNPADDCRLDRTVYLVDLDPVAFPAGNNQKGGKQFNTREQIYGTLELNYRPTDALTLTSVSGYYNFDSDLYFSSFQAGFAMNSFGTTSRYQRDEFTQEIRLNSDFKGPLNFTVGGFYQDATIKIRTLTVNNMVLNIPTANPANLGGTLHTLKIKSKSVFGQLRFRPSEQFEIAAGGRYTDEDRQNSLIDPLSSLPVTIPRPKIGSKTFSPEATVTWFPSDDMTLFASFKKGYKSGSYSLGRLATSGPGVVIDNSFGEEKVEGAEGGLKARLADGQLATNLGAYYYKFKGLQFSVTQAGAVAGGTLPFTRVLNAGGARIYGLEWDVNYRPRSIEGLSLNADVAYNNSKFTDLQGVPCYGGQTIALGCNQVPRPATAAEIAAGTFVIDPATGTRVRFTAQEDLAGLPLIRAPKWQINFGAVYKIPLSNGWRLTLSSDTHFASRQLLNIGRRADFFQGSYVKVDAAALLSGPDDRWELALIGKNLNNKITSGLCSTSNFANYSRTAAQVTGTNNSGADGIDELGCTAERGRSIIVRLTLRPFGR